MKNDPEIIVLESDALYRQAAERFVGSARRSVEQRGAFCVALSGGSTPRSLYRLLAKPAFSRQIPWQQVQVFWGDERCVPPTDPESNFRTASESLLAHVSIPGGNVHRIRGELGPHQAAQEYGRSLRSTPSLPMVRIPPNGQELPRFDLILLGLGEDGHTASLFPESGALREDQQLVVENWVESVGTWRVTLTVSVINAAVEVMFLVSGSGKAQTLQRVLEGPWQPERLPAQMIKPADGSLTWLIDTEAAAFIGES